MAAVFLDLDGTFFQHGTNIPLPGAVATCRVWGSKGHVIIITTLRSSLSEDEEQYLESLIGKPWNLKGIPLTFLTGIPSPRIVINDEGAHRVNHKTNTPWPEPYARLNLG